MRRALLLVALLGCKRSTPTNPAPPDTAPSVVASTSALPTIDPHAHVALLEEVAAVHGKKLPCAELDTALAPLRTKLKALGDASDPRLGRAIEADDALRARRTKALEAIMDGVMRCRRP